MDKKSEQITGNMDRNPDPYDTGMTDQDIQETLEILRRSLDEIPEELQHYQTGAVEVDALLAEQIPERSARRASGKNGHAGSGSADRKKEPLAAERVRGQKGVRESTDKSTSGGLRRQLLQVTILPILMLIALVMIVSYMMFALQIKNEIKTELADTAVTIEKLLDLMYEGEYNSVAVDDYSYVVCKGDHVLNDEDSEILDSLKEQTGIEYSFFYLDTRILTTIRERDVRYIGTLVSSRIRDSVIGEGREMFYDNAVINGEKYYAYYKPVYNSAQECIGMLGFAKPVSSVTRLQLRSVLPIFLAALAGMMAAIWISLVYTRKLVGNLKQVETFLMQVARGNLSSGLSETVLRRPDELGQMGRSVVSMQKAIRGLIEKDALTTMYNRRYGERQLQVIRKNAEKCGTSYALAIGDIDFFKKVNDTYGHECGDMVLKAVSGVMRRHMMGKGFVARWGGEEFLLVFDRMSLEEAVAEIEQMMERIHALEIVYAGQRIHVTMSFGVTTGSNEIDISLNLKKADENLYLAKQNGRDRVIGESCQILQS